MGLTQEQIDAANGDAATQLPAGLTRPKHWTEPSHEGRTSTEHVTFSISADLAGRLTIELPRAAFAAAVDAAKDGNQGRRFSFHVEQSCNRGGLVAWREKPLRRLPHEKCLPHFDIDMDQRGGRRVYPPSQASKTASASTPFIGFRSDVRLATPLR